MWRGSVDQREREREPGLAFSSCPRRLFSESFLLHEGELSSSIAAAAAAA